MRIAIGFGLIVFMLLGAFVPWSHVAAKLRITDPWFEFKLALFPITVLLALAAWGVLHH